MKKFILFLILAISCSICCISCSTDNNKEEVASVHIYDCASVLSQQITDSLLKMETSSIPLVIVTLESMDHGNIDLTLDSIFKKYTDPSQNMFNGALIVGDKSNNTAFIKYGKAYEGIRQSFGEYATNEYYLTQIDNSIPIETKVWQMSRCAVSSANHVLETQLTSIICGEIFGPLFNLVEPSNDFFYKYIIYPAQLPIIWLIDVTHSLYWGLLIFGILLYGITYLISKYLN